MLPDALAPAASEPTIDLSTLTKRTIVFNMDMGNGYLNGMDFDKGPFTITSTAGTYEIWEIVNPTVMDQPFHLQGGSFRVLSIVGGDIDYARVYTGTPAKKDTVIVPRMGTVALLVPVTGSAGTTWFGSRIPEHADIGMMGRWEVTGELSRREEPEQRRPPASACSGTGRGRPRSFLAEHRLHAVEEHVRERRVSPRPSSTTRMVSRPRRSDFLGGRRRFQGRVPRRVQVDLSRLAFRVALPCTI